MKRELKIKPGEWRTGDMVRVSGVAVVEDCDGFSRLNVIPNSERVRLVHRPHSPKPKVGATLTGAELKKTWWKRGTKFALIKQGKDVELQYLRTGLPPALIGGVWQLTAVGNFDISGGWWGTFRGISDDTEFVLIDRPLERGETSVR